MQAGRDERNSAEFKTFCRQLFHECLAFIFSPLKPWMVTPKVVRCPDGYYRRAIFGLGPYIADYPEQVWLSAIVSGWCPKYALLSSCLPKSPLSALSVDETASLPEDAKYFPSGGASVEEDAEAMTELGR